jgi:ribonuclease HII
MKKAAAALKIVMPDYALESAFRGPVCGIDEAGRGPLAGPVVAACVHIPPAAREQDFWRGVTDSKKLNATQREVLFAQITTHSVFGIAEATVMEIDELNIHHATLLAMKRAYEAMNGVSAVAALVDGKFGPKITCKVQTVVGGDGRSLSIAAASILAKVTRDRIMRTLHAEYPHYGWESNAGYPTAAHIDGVKQFGITPHHRRSYGPIRQAVQGCAE